MLSITGYTQGGSTDDAWEIIWVETLYEDTAQEDGSHKYTDERIKDNVHISVKAYCKFLSTYFQNRSFDLYKAYVDPESEKGITHNDVGILAELADLTFRHCGVYLPK